MIQHVWSRLVKILQLRGFVGGLLTVFLRRMIAHSQALSSVYHSALERVKRRIGHATRSTPINRVSVTYPAFHLSDLLSN